MERRKACLLRIRENCPFRRLRRNRYDVSAASSAVGSYWKDLSPPTNNQPISTVYSEPLPPLLTFQNVYIPHQSQVAVGLTCISSQKAIHMDLDSAPVADISRNNLSSSSMMSNLQHRAIPSEDSMDLDSGVDPETGERAQG